MKFIIILAGILKHLIYFKFSTKTMIALLFLFAFVLRVINNHILLIQRKQILRQQILKQNIPEECFMATSKFIL